MQAKADLFTKARSGIRAALASANELSRFQLGVIFALVALFAAGSIISFAGSRPREVEVLPGAGGAKEAVLNVHVAGEVASPGLYRLPAGSRVADALESAGGPTDGAVLDDVNLAARLKDGEKIRVPSAEASIERGEAAHPRDSQAASTYAGAGPVDLNTAGAAELETLPGIGPVFAARIIEYRAKNGPFTTVEQLGEVEGIGPRRMESLKGQVKI